MALKKSYSNFDDLLNGIIQNIEGIMRNDVAPAVESKLAQSASENVDQKYNRSGGITDPACIVSEVECDSHSVTLTVKDIAKPQKPILSKEGFDLQKDAAAGGTMFANWIENGLWMDIATYWRTGEKVKRPARKFIEPVQLEAIMITQAALKSL